MSVTGHASGFWGALRRSILGMLVAVAGGAVVAAIAAPPAVASATLNWAAGVPSPLPSDAGANPGVEMHALSCASTGNCSAIGRYNDDVSDRLGLLLTETSGTWTAVEATLPAGADANPLAALNAVSCASAGDCSAVGAYRASGNTLPVILTQTSGTWGAGVSPTLPSAAPNPQAALRSVSCTSAGNCSAVGDYVDSSGNQQGVLLTETSGIWGPAVEASLPAVPSGNPHVLLLSVSCVSAGNCTAVGHYTDNSGNGQGVLLTETSGAWATGVTAPLPAAAPDPQVVLRSISCVSAGNCAAGGEYQDSATHGQGLLLNETSGVWTAATATAPPDAATDPQSYVHDVSCTGAGSCSATGGYTDASTASQGLLLTETAGTWAAGSKAVLPAGAAADPQVSLNSLSCFSAGNCAAIGEFKDGAGTQGMLAAETAGTWTPAVKASLPADAGTDPKVVMGSVSCTSPTNCAAIGRYNTATVQQGVLVAAANASPALSVAAPSSGAVGQAIAGSAVTATLSLGAAPTGGIQFRVFGPQASPPSACLTGGDAVGGTVTVSDNGAYHPSAAFTPTTAGTYWWFASYGGDLSDSAAASACGASMATTVIAPVSTAAPGAVLPVVSNFKQTHVRWREGKALATISAKRRPKPKPKPPIGTVFTFTLNQTAGVKLVFTQAKKVKATLSLTAKAGSNKIRFQGRISRKQRLARGRYTVTITATNAAHVTSAPSQLSFTIVT